MLNRLNLLAPVFIPLILLTSTLAAEELTAPATPLALGSSKFAFPIDAGTLEVFAYKPESYRGEKMILVMHGVLRNADEYRDHAKQMGDRHGALIIAPRFDKERFPTPQYQFGGILREDKTAAPEDQWTYRWIPRIAQHVRAREQRKSLPYWIIGHSAGGQFVARMSAFIDTGAERLVAANSGSHLFPTYDAPFGYGFGNLPESLANDDRLQHYLSAPLTIYLGTADDHPDDNFDDSEPAMQQGSGRWQRGTACFQMAKRLAQQRGWTFNWRLVEADGIGHDHERMFNHPACDDALSK